MCTGRDIHQLSQIRSVTQIVQNVLHHFIVQWHNSSLTTVYIFLKKIVVFALFNMF